MGGIEKYKSEGQLASQGPAALPPFQPAREQP